MTVSAKHDHRHVVRRTGALRRLARAAVATLAAFTLLGGVAVAAADELGIDVSRYQHPQGTSIDWAAVKADGVTFAFIKATESTSYTNPYFAGDWAATRTVGLYHGAYHFARPSAGSAGAQAQYFVSKAGLADQPGDLPPVLDLEQTGGLGVSALKRWTSNWLVTVEELTGRKPIIYTSPYFWTNYMGNSTAFTSYPLWIANYGVSSPHVPGGWPTWTFWQGNSTGSVTGISGDVDMNAFNGTLDQLAAIANGPVAPAPASEPAPDPSPVPAPAGETQPSTTKVPTATTLAVSRAGVYRGQSVTLSGALTTDNGQPLPNRKVVLKVRPEGETTWTRLAALPTDETGHFATTSRVTAATSYRAVFPGATRYARSVSAVQSVTLLPKTVTELELHASRTSVAPGRRVKLYGHLTTAGGAALNGSKVSYFVRPAGSTRWTWVGTSTTLAPTGWHQLFVKPARTSTYKAVYGGGLRFTRARSALVKVAVR